MEQVELTAEKRTVFGKKTKRLRKAGLIPATLYGPETEAMSLQVSELELRGVLNIAGTNQLIRLRIEGADEPSMILAREIQRDVITHSLLHVDLYQVVMTEKITAEIPLDFVGEAPAVAADEGLLMRGLDSVEVECLPGALVDAIEVDVSVLEEIDQAIHVKDLVVDDSIEILTSPDEVVAKVLLVKEEVFEEVVEEEEIVAPEVEFIAPEEREYIPEEEELEPEEGEREEEGEEAWPE